MSPGKIFKVFFSHGPIIPKALKKPRMSYSYLNSFIMSPYYPVSYRLQSTKCLCKREKTEVSSGVKNFIGFRYMIHKDNNEKDMLIRCEM